MSKTAKAIRILTNGGDTAYSFSEDGKAIWRRVKVEGAWTPPKVAMKLLKFETCDEFLGFVERNYGVLDVTRYGWCEICEQRVKDNHNDLFHGQKED